MMQALLILIAVMLAGCASSAAPQKAPVPIDLTKDQAATVHDGVRKMLKDPDSARFGAVHAGQRSAGQIVICGMVNARNSFGGYTGEKLYTGVLNDYTDAASKKVYRNFTVAALGGDATSDFIAQQACFNAGGVLP